jgi:phosphoserine phosphatase
MKAAGSDPAVQADHRDKLGNWYPDNLNAIQRALNAVGTNPGPDRPAAVFDFDNTCVFRDVGQAVYRMQLTGLRYRLRPEELAAILPDGVEEIGGKPLAAVRSMLLDAYTSLWPLIEQNEQARARTLPEYRLFTALLLWLTAATRRDARFGSPFVLPFMGRLLAGYTLEELRRFAAEVLRTAQAEPLAEERLQAEAPAPIGPVEAGLPTGLQAQAEMRQLIRTLGEGGIDCYVVSASTEWVVREAVRQLGFAVAEERIFGIRVGLDGAGRLTTADPEKYPVTYRQGKVEVIERFVKRTPILVAGDADTDYDMLTLPGVRLRLLINRNLNSLIASLYNRSDILLQGLDLRTGRFRPFRETVGP